MDYRTVGGGGKPPVKTFSDNFVRANNRYLGSNYIPAIAFGSAQSLTTSVGIQTNQLQFSDSSVNQTQFYPECFVPIQGAPNLNGKAQFAKFTWATGNNVTGTRSLHCGVAVFISIDPALGFSCYSVEVQDETANQNFIVRKFTQVGGFTTLFTSTAGDVPNTGPATIELAVAPGATSVALSTFLNGALINTTVDSSTPILTGIPGLARVLWASTASPGTAVTTFSAFSIGPGR